MEPEVSAPVYSFPSIHAHYTMQPGLLCMLGHYVSNVERTLPVQRILPFCHSDSYPILLPPSIAPLK